MTSSYITRVPGLVFRDVWLHVPLDYNAPHGETITLFARVVSSTTSYHKAQELPFLVYLQGGPGFAAPRPLGNSGWLKRALSEYRVVLLDQRGVGYSSPIICSVRVCDVALPLALSRSLISVVVRVYDSHSRTRAQLNKLHTSLTFEPTTLCEVP